MVTVLRPLSTSELLDRTFQLYRNHFVMFVGITALPQVAVLGLRLGYALSVLPRYLEGRTMPVILVVLANFIAIEIAHAATVTAVSNLHLDLPTGIALAYSAARTSLLRVVGVSLAVVLIPILITFPIGLILAAIVGVIAGSGAGGESAAMIRLAAALMVLAMFLLPLRWWLAWSLVVPVTVLEGGSLRTSMRRSKSLTQGNRGRIFLTYLLIALLSWVVSVLFQLPFFVTTGLRVFRNPVLVTALARVLQATGAFFSASLLGPLLTIAFTLIYYDQRVRKEGFDLQLMMSTLESGVPNAAAAPAS